ncbi:hypothetical protein [Burkholderia phage vB_BglM_WTB]
MSKYILSTMTTSVSYGFYHMVGSADPRSGGPVPVERKKITIRGGANLPSDRSGIGEMVQDSEGRPIWTAAGFVTPVSDADYEELKDHKIFKMHLEANLLKVLNTDLSDGNSNHKRVLAASSDMSTTDHLALMNQSRLKQKIKVIEGLSQQGSQFRL